MRFKADENISARVIRLLQEHGHDVATVPDEGLVGASDDRIAQAAASEGRAVISLDRGSLMSAAIRQARIPESSWSTPVTFVPVSF